ncbi:hypothetical protein SUGI_0581960 [Cryptomeria japonica]|nr:hypothetical protein SUGI_0581960 [Cryptomeria japonica]
MGSRLHSSTVKIREGFCFEMARISISAFAGDPTNIEPASSAENDNISYSSKAIEPHTKASEDESTTTVKLNCEETESTAASADAVGSAEEAQKAAKNSTDLVGECKNFEDSQSEENLVICEQSRLTEKEKPEVVKALDQFQSQAIEEESSSNVACPRDFPPVSVSKHVAKATIHSQKRSERRARRMKAGVKIIKLAADVPSHKRYWTFRLLNFLDAEHVLRDSINSESLTATEEIELSKGIQDLLKLHRIRLRLVGKTGHQPTLDRWAQAVGTDKKTLKRRLLVGEYCKEKLYRSNLGLVGYVAKKYMGLGIGYNYKDLFQIGCFGLIKGIERFDYRKGSRFATYAHWWIRQRISRALYNYSDIVSYNEKFFWDMNRVKQTKRWLKQLHARRPRFRELARITGLSVKTLMLIRMYTRKRRKFADEYADPNAASPENIFEKQELGREIVKSLNFVTKKEREILRLRYGFDDGRPKSLGEIGYICNYSKERIRQIEKDALRKIRESRSHNLRHYLYS